MREQQIEDRATESHNLRMAAELLLGQSRQELAECKDAPAVERPALQARLEKQMARPQRPHRRKRLAIALTAAILVVSLMGCAGIVAHIVTLLSREQTTHVDYGGIDETGLAEFTYLPNEIPTGYMQQEPVITPFIRDIHFVNGRGDTIRFTESDDSLTYSMDNEAERQETIMLSSGASAHLVTGNSGSAIFWQQDDKFLCIQGNLDKETILWIANSVRKTE